MGRECLVCKLDLGEDRMTDLVFYGPLPIFINGVGMHRGGPVCVCCIEIFEVLAKQREEARDSLLSPADVPPIVVSLTPASEPARACVAA